MAKRAQGSVSRRQAVTLASGTLFSTFAGAAAARGVDQEGLVPVSALSRDGLQTSSIGFMQTGTGAIARSVQDKAGDVRDVRDYGVVASNTAETDGPDQTEKLIAVFKGLAADGFRGAVTIPYGVKFDVAALYRHVPLGVTLLDESSVNWGQPPAYRSRLRIEFTQDHEADDAQNVIASSHHPAIMLLNFGTAGSRAARDRLASLTHAVGQDHRGDPMLGWMMQFGRNQVDDKWNWGLRLQTPYSVGVANPQPWRPRSRYAQGAYCVGHGDRIYRTTEGGVSGVAIPADVGVVRDGQIRWDYVQQGLNIDRTVLDLQEDGRLGVYGQPEARVGLAGGDHKAFHSVHADGAVRWRDETRSLDIITVTNAFGLRPGIAGSDHWLAISGSTPDAPVTGAGKVRNGTPTIMRSMVAPEDRVTMTVVLRFDDSDTTLRHGPEFQLRDARDVRPAAGSFLTLKLDRTDSGAWREFQRSF